MKTAILSDDRALQRIRAPWQDLFQAAGQHNPFLSWEWHSMWWRHFAGGREPLLLTLEADGQVVGVIPMITEYHSGHGRRLSLVWSDEVTDCADALVLPSYAEDLARALLGFLRDQRYHWQRVVLPGLPASSLLLHGVTRIASEYDLLAEATQVETCPRVALPTTWEEYLASLDKKDRHELRRKTRRASASGIARHVVLTEAEQVGSAMPEFFRLHRLSAAAKARFMTPAMQGFFADLAQSFAQRCWLRLSFFELDEVKIATALSFACGDRVFLYNSGHDPSHHFLSPGIVLTGWEIKEVIQEGARVYDFLRGNESYKYQFGARDSLVYWLEMTSREAGKPAQTSGNGKPSEMVPRC